MKSLLISTAIILAIGLGGSLIYNIFVPHQAVSGVTAPRQSLDNAPASYQTPDQTQIGPPGGATLYFICAQARRLS